MHKKPIILSIVALQLTFFCCCTQQKDLVVQPINAEFNHAYLSGDLDSSFFNAKEVIQYYQVSNYEDLTGRELLLKLDKFAKSSFPPAKLSGIHELELLFYKKHLFVDYNDHLYASARDNDNRRLEGYSAELLATVTFKETKENPGKIAYKRVVYNGKHHITAHDTIPVR